MIKLIRTDEEWRPTLNKIFVQGNPLLQRNSYRKSVFDKKWKIYFVKVY